MDRFLSSDGFLRCIKAKLDAKNEFRITDNIAELREFGGGDVCI
jgi:hypothetical protein